MKLILIILDQLWFICQAAIGNTGTHIIQCHGDCDPVVPFKFGQITSSLIKKFAVNIEFKTYPGMMHTSCDEVTYAPPPHYWDAC